MGKEILDEVMKNPKSFRMGDIFYQIQETVNKNSRQIETGPTKEELAKK